MRLPKVSGKQRRSDSECGLGDVQRRFPQCQHLRQSVAVIGVFVSDENPVEVVDGHFDGGQPRQRFALAKAGIYQESGALRLE